MARKVTDCNLGNCHYFGESAAILLAESVENRNFCHCFGLFHISKQYFFASLVLNFQ